MLLPYIYIYILHNMLPSNPIHLKHQNYQIQTGSITFFKLAVTTNQCFEAKSGPSHVPWSKSIP